MRKFLRSSLINFQSFYKRPKPGVHIINAHYINSLNDSDNGLQFLKQLQYLEKHAELIRFEQAVELIDKKSIVDKPLIAFSFDDGFLDCYTTIAPMLEDFNTNAAFFINPNFVEPTEVYYKDFSKRVTVNGKQSMNWKQIKDLHTRGHIIGGHTMDHINLGIESLSELDINNQIVVCKEVIENKIGNNCNTFAFPYGTFSNLSEKSLNLLSKHYEYVFSGTDYKNYFSFEGRVINRRHIEPFWPISHMKYFLSVNKKYN